MTSQYSGSSSIKNAQCPVCSAAISVKPLPPNRSSTFSVARDRQRTPLPVAPPRHPEWWAQYALELHVGQASRRGDGHLQSIGSIIVRRLRKQSHLLEQQGVPPRELQRPGPHERLETLNPRQLVA